MELPKVLQDLVVIDIETISQYSSFNELPDRFKELWEKKANTLKWGQEISLEEGYFKKAAIYSEFGKIACISLGYFHLDKATGALELRVKAIYNHDERLLLEAFNEMITKFPQPVRLLAHNGKECDYPYLGRRMLINGVQLPGILQLSGKKSWEVPHLDTMEMWKFGDYKHYTSLELLAAVFGVESSKNDINGSMVNEVYYSSGDLARIAEYCSNDVIVTAQIFLKMNGIAQVPNESIIKS